jgi:radical SAM protein (TIGR01212 family)
MGTQLIHYFHDHLVATRGSRVQKLCIDGGFTCPNRDGTKARGGCLFCDAAGSGAAHIAAASSIAEQVALQKERCRQRYHASLFIAYFQAFSNTYAPIDALRVLYEQAIMDDEVIGLSVGTRADCVDAAVCQLLRSCQARGKRVWVEIGIQTVNQQTLDRMNRAETVDDFAKACRLVKEHGLELVTHVIAGLPGDCPADFRSTIEFVNCMRADGIKIHNLYIDSRSRLAGAWRAGEVRTLEWDEYVALVADAIERLSPHCLVHRLSGQAPRPYHLAPDWALDKTRVIKGIEAELYRRRTSHGSRFVPPSDACSP